MNLLLPLIFVSLPFYLVSSLVGLIISICFLPLLGVSYFLVGIAKVYRWFVITKLLVWIDQGFVKLQKSFGTHSRHQKARRQEEIRRKLFETANNRVYMTSKSRTSSFTSQRSGTPPLSRVNSGSSLGRRSPKASSLASLSALQAMGDPQLFQPKFMRSSHSRSPTSSPGPGDFYIPIKKEMSRIESFDRSGRKRTSSGQSIKTPKPIKQVHLPDSDMDADDETDEGPILTRRYSRDDSREDTDEEELFMKTSPQKPPRLPATQFQGTSPVDPLNNYLISTDFDMTPQEEMALFRVSSGFDLDRSTLSLGTSPS